MELYMIVPVTQRLHQRTQRFDLSSWLLLALDVDAGYHSSRLARGGPTRLTPRSLAALAADWCPARINLPFTLAGAATFNGRRKKRAKPATDAAPLEWEWLHFTSQTKPFNLTFVIIHLIYLMKMSPLLTPPYCNPSVRTYRRELNTTLRYLNWFHSSQLSVIKYDPSHRFITLLEFFT